MKNYFFKILFLGAALAFVACSSRADEQETTPPVVVVPPIVDNDILTTTNVTNYMVDANATKETIALFYNLKKLAKTKFAIGQQDAFTGFYKNVGGDADIKKTTSFDSAVIGLDFIFITDKQNNGQSNNWFYQQELLAISNAKAGYAKRMITTFSWHLREPNKEDSFYAADMTTTEKATAFRSILAGGTNHEWYKKKLDKLASVFLNLKGDKGEWIPVIFRPFHEFDGSWFWWGSDFCTPDEYKKAYQFTVDYLKNTKNVHNVLYAFSPDRTYSTTSSYLSRYPGDKYVDVLGMDNYGDFDKQGQTGADLANAKLKMIADLGKEKVKIVALTETGYRVTPTLPPIDNWFSTYLYSALTKNNIEVSYVVFWSNNLDGYYVPTPEAPNAADFKTFATKPKAALVNSLPKMYELPK